MAGLPSTSGEAPVWLCPAGGRVRQSVRDREAAFSPSRGSECLGRLRWPRTAQRPQGPARRGPANSLQLRGVGETTTTAMVAMTGNGHEVKNGRTLPSSWVDERCGFRGEDVVVVAYPTYLPSRPVQRMLEWFRSPGVFMCSAS